VGHLVDGRLVVEEVAAVERLIDVHPLAETLLSNHIGAGVDPALGTDAVRPLDRDQREQIDRHAGFGDADGGGQTRQSPADHYDSFFVVRHLGHFQTSVRVVGRRRAECCSLRCADFACNWSICFSLSRSTIQRTQWYRW
jgi:hypothetical protein